jgi:putative ABC transport system substrate-binding protein
MDRQAFIMAVAAGPAVAPLTLSAQPAGKVWRIGFLGNSPPTTQVESLWDAFRQALQERGYVEGRNLVIERRFIEGDPQKTPGFAAELVSREAEPVLVPIGAGNFRLLRQAL